MTYSSDKKISIIFCFFITAFVLAYSFKVKTERYFNNPLEDLLKELPDSTLKTLAGKNIDLRSFRTGKKGLVVHFWGTWCAPCEIELPSLLKMIDRFNNEDVDFLLIAVRDDVFKIQKFFKKFNNISSDHLKLVLDENGETMAKFGTFKLPETYIFDKNGYMKKKFVGPQDWDNSYFKNQIQYLLNP